jgi:hypothetical protein
VTSSTADWYLRFAENEAHGRSAIYEEWARGVAADPLVLELIAGLPLPKQQPNLVFATARLLGAPGAGWSAFRPWLVEHWEAVAAEARQRGTQTNEPGRCAALLPALALVPGPIGLLEVGASAGLTLIPDRYAYRYDGVRVGQSELVLGCATFGSPPLPRAVPDIAWRAGIDLAPLDVRSTDDMHWLEILLWPEQAERRARLRSAIEIARRDPPRLVAGDAIDTLPELAAQVPDGHPLVVVSAGTLVYLPGKRRARFRELIRELGAHWISMEGLGVLPDLVPARMPPTPGTPFLITLDERALALADPHGSWLTWL